MQAGKIDRRITLQRFTTTQDAGSGEEIQVWGTLATVWASKEDVSDGERRAAAEVQSHLTSRFVIRRSSDVADLNTKDRLVYNGDVYGIEGVKETKSGRLEGIEISATKRNDA